MSVIAAALRELIAAGLAGDELVAAVARIEAEMAVSSPVARSSDAAERKREADRERLRRKREVARAANSRAHHQETSQVSHEVADCRATSATSRDGGDPPLDKMSPRPPKNYSPPFSTPSATDCDAADRQDEFGEALAAFNRMAAEVGLPEAQGLIRKRRVALKARLQECGGIAGWRIAMDRVRSSPFLRGDNDRGWRASLDFLLKPESFAKPMEGAYDPAPGAGKRREGDHSGGGRSVRSSPSARPSAADAFAAALVEHPDSEFGRRARAAGFGGTNGRSRSLRGGDAIIAGMARVAERRFGRHCDSDDGEVIDGDEYGLVCDPPRV